jgi:hypothetical protein
MRIELRRKERGLAIAGTGGVIAALACIACWPRAALTGWLGAAVMIQSLPMGALALLAMMQLMRGDWEAGLRPVCEAAALLLPLAAAAFLPVLLGMAVIYDWDSAQPSSAFQAAWLGYAPFAVRMLVWFAALAWIAHRQVGRQASQGASSLALIVITLGGSLLAVDWLMSLDPKFHSSGFGLQLLALEIAAAYMVLLIARLRLPDEPRRDGAPYGVLGGLLLLLLLIWAYFQFLPYFIIWSGNLPDGVAWYHRRSAGWWAAALWAFGLLGGVPILALLLPRFRTSKRWLGRLAAMALAGKAVEFAWFAVPGRGWPALLAYALALAGLACLCAAALPIALRRRSAP